MLIQLAQCVLAISLLPEYIKERTPILTMIRRRSMDPFQPGNLLALCIEHSYSKISLSS